MCLPLDVVSQVAVQDSGGGEEAGLWQGNEQLTRLTEETGTEREKNILTLKNHKKKTAELFMTGWLEVSEFLVCLLLVYYLEEYRVTPAL